ncbi:MAG: glycerol acyltransferase [Bacteroidetes bacterium]|nr:glycerol acyltransferase [Bacteroidota bacterium]
MPDNYNFDEIRPFKGEEVNLAIRRITSEEVFYKVLKSIFPEKNIDDYILELNRITTTYDFQIALMHKLIRRIIEVSSDGLSSSGFENISPDSSYLFISNHRDIFLDSGILQVLLVEHGFDTTQITFGNNLMDGQLITDVGKVNKMFTVFREGTGREIYENSKRLSSYMRYCVTKGKESVWIAQRNGRTKDGDDKTQTGLLKMLNVSNEGSFYEGFKELQIVPVSVSYELEPCDILKTQELNLSQNYTYKKSAGEDVNSIVKGVVEHKGKIHFAIGKPISKSLEEIEHEPNLNKKIELLGNSIDEQIYQNYKLWPTNYVAYDLFHKKAKYDNYYTTEEKEKFLAHINMRLENSNGDRETLKQMLFKMYANPIINFQNL